MLKLQKVRVVYPDKTQVIHDVSFTLDQGESIALIGGNGAGKTSLLLTIVGILEQAGGEIFLDELLLNKRNVTEMRKRVGFVFQNPDDQLFMPLIYDDIAFGCRNFGMPEDEIEIRVEKVLKQLNIGHLQSRSSLKLSGGEKRMAAIAAVLAMSPSVLMLDEPTAFLDPKARQALIQVLQKLDLPKLIATHDLSFAEQVCNRTIILKDGVVAADGPLSLLEDRVLLQNCGLL